MPACTAQDEYIPDGPYDEECALLAYADYTLAILDCDQSPNPQRCCTAKYGEYIMDMVNCMS